MSGLKEVLAGLTALRPGGGERRDGQLEMAAAVDDAITNERHLVVRAGTGTGKSLAYLVPAALHDRRVVVATATKALQDQLATKDLPLVEGHLGVSWAVLKGRQNYLCRQRLDELAHDRQLALAGVDDGADSAEIDRLVAWAVTTTTGDRAELPREPSAAAWSAVSVGAHECPGAATCPQGANCFSEAARNAAAGVKIVVVNTHLYGLHLAGSGGWLPEHEVVVIDEAHQLEDTISATAGIELSGGRVHTMSRAVGALLTDPATRQRLDDAAERLTAVLAPRQGQRLTIDRGDELGIALDAVRTAADRALEAVRQLDDKTNADVRAKVARLRRLAGDLMSDIEHALELSDAYVAWVGGRATAPLLLVAPIDVGETLATRLWNTVPTVVLTSATIPDAMADIVGLAPDTYDQIDVGSPFDYESSALLYCPAHLPDPRSAAYEAAMHDELVTLINAAGGRTLALFTSWRAMEAAVENVGPRLGFPLLHQRELPKAALLKAFSRDPATCLFATMSFWQGVDVPGDTLSLVTIDRIPFPRPDEPLLEARRDRAGRDAFRRVDLPRAATMLAQGTGRLVRTSTDRGVVAILDPRLATNRAYRWDLVNALPPYRRTKDRAEVTAFLRSLRTSVDQ
jgi:ATP-dependent DNA helicase DinG